MERGFHARGRPVGVQHAARQEAHHIGVAHCGGVPQCSQPRQRQAREPRATDRAQIGAAAFHQQRLPELDRCVPAARLDQPWLPPDQSGEIDELVELVGAGRGGATAPTILDSRGCFPHGSVRGGPVPSIPLAITSLRVVLRSSAANAGTTLSMRSAKRADAAAMR